jgi:hypothetical protein
VVSNKLKASASPTSSIAIYSGGQGQPQFYSDPDFQIFSSCTYDDNGNVFVNGAGDSVQLAELPAGGSTFTSISLPLKSRGYYVQWDGTYLAITIVTHYPGIVPKYEIVRVQVSGSAGKVIGRTKLGTRSRLLNQTWIQGPLLLSSPQNLYKPELFMWRYPTGGKPIHIKPVQQVGGSSGLTVSVAPR